MEKDTRPIKIVVTGPESTGKSSLCQELANHFKTIWIPEFAREYLEDLGRPYEEADLTEIALGQKHNEDQVDKNGIYFVDTSFEVLKIWSEWKYQRCSDAINALFEENQVDLYLLLYPDLPWQHEPLRENPDDRLQLFEIYRNLLSSNNLPFEIIKGSGSERVENAIEKVNKNFNLDF